jgi:hypothetical protein
MGGAGAWLAVTRGLVIAAPPTVEVDVVGVLSR